MTEVRAGDRDVAYAQSLAMVLLIVARSGEAGIATAIDTLYADRDVGENRARLPLWPRMFSDVGGRGLLDALARRLFALGLGSELDGILRGNICCHEDLGVREFVCRGAPRGEESKFIDRTRWSMEYCFED